MIRISSVYLTCALLAVTNAFPTRLTTHERRKQASKTTLGAVEDIFGAVHRKEFEMKKVKAQHTSTTDPVRMAMSYAQESVSPMRLAKALRRVYEDPANPANPESKEERHNSGGGLSGMRRASFIVDIKRKSLSHPRETFCHFDDAGTVAQAMVRLGADAVFVNTDYVAYGGDMTELVSAVKAVRQVSTTAAVVMKDIIVDEIQLGLAKHSGADGVVLQACVLGPALDSFLDLATFMGLECIVECHSRNEVERALSVNVAPTILVNNYDRIGQKFYPNQAVQLAGLFPGSGGPIITLATGGIANIDDMKRHLTVGYDGVVVGKAVMGSPMAPQFIRAVRDRTLLPAELSHWGQGLEFDSDGNAITTPRDISSSEADAYQ